MNEMTYSFVFTLNNITFRPKFFERQSVNNNQLIILLLHMLHTEILIIEALVKLEREVLGLDQECRLSYFLDFLSYLRKL